MALVKNQKNKEILSDREELLLFTICAVLIIGIFISKALITMAIIGVVILSCRHITWSKFLSFFNDKVMMPLVLVFLAVFLSGGYSENIEGWQTAVRVKLPFLILPFAIYMLPSLKQAFIVRLHSWLIFTCLVVGTYVSIQAFINYDEILALLAKGQPIPTPIEHVKYSMFNAYAALSGIILLGEGVLSEKKYLWVLRIATFLIILLMHLLAVRTGLVILYVSILLYLGLKFIRNSSIKKLLLLLIGAICFPIVAYHSIPTVQQKIAYMKYDWTKYMEGSGEHYSDSERIMSYKAGWAVWKSNPIIGAGYGDVQDEVRQYYEKYYKREKFLKLPHSQFLLTMSGSGILGLLIFIAGFFTPMLIKRKHTISSVLLGFLYLNYTLSFLVENSLERSISVAFFLLFALFLLRTSEQ